MDESRARRIGKNEILYRTVNEEIRALDRRLGAAAVPTQSFVCECGQATCTERIELTSEEYERIRADPATFAVVPGHEQPDVEDVVGRAGNHNVVRKHSGEPTELATRHAPR
jgi:hypothetical protein